MMEDSAVFVLSSYRGPAGSGPGECIHYEDVHMLEKYNQLDKIQNWRTMLSSFYAKKDSPLFTLDGRKWKSVEHYFQAQKFLHTDLYERFTWESGSKLSQSYGMEVVNAGINAKMLPKALAAWKRSGAKEALACANKAKFEQNPYLMDVLVKTHGAILKTSKKHYITESDLMKIRDDRIAYLNKDRRMLTDTDDVNREILLKVDYKFMRHAYLTCKYVMKICDNIFWRRYFALNYTDPGVSNRDYKVMVSELYIMRSMYFSNDSQIRYAIRQKLPKLVDHLLTKYSGNKFTGRYLLEAVRSGSLEIVKIIASGCKLSFHNTYDILMDSLEQPDIFAYLVQNGFNIHAYNGYCLTAAVEKQDIRLVNMIINLGFNVNQYGDGSMYAAALRNNLNIVKLFINCGFEFNNCTQAFIAAARSNSIDILVYFIEHGVDVHANDDVAIIVAAGRGNLEALIILENAGADIRAENDGALREAIFNKKVNVIAYLLNKIPGVLPPGLLTDAIITSDINIIKMIAPRTNILDSRFITEAVSNNVDIGVIKYLISIGATIGVGDSVCIHYAINYYRLDIIKLLIENGADVHYNYDLAFRTAFKKNDGDMMLFLKKHGANVNIMNEEPYKNYVKTYAGAVKKNIKK